MRAPRYECIGGDQVGQRVEALCEEGKQPRVRLRREVTLVSLNIPAVSLRDSRAGKIATKHDHLWDEIILYAVVEDLL